MFGAYQSFAVNRNREFYRLLTFTGSKDTPVFFVLSIAKVCNQFDFKKSRF